MSIVVRYDWWPRRNEAGNASSAWGNDLRSAILRVAGSNVEIFQAVLRAFNFVGWNASFETPYQLNHVEHDVPKHLRAWTFIEMVFGAKVSCVFFFFNKNPSLHIVSGNYFFHRFVKVVNGEIFAILGKTKMVELMTKVGVYQSYESKRIIFFPCLLVLVISVGRWCVNLGRRHCQ